MGGGGVERDFRNNLTINVCGKYPVVTVSSPVVCKADRTNLSGDGTSHEVRPILLILVATYPGMMHCTVMLVPRLPPPLYSVFRSRLNFSTNFYKQRGKFGRRHV